MIKDKVNKHLRTLSLLDTVGCDPYTFICYEEPADLSWWQRFIKKGFRHCFIIHWNGAYWMRIEKLKGYHEPEALLFLDSYGLGNENIKPYFESKGYTCQNVELTERVDNKLRAIFALDSCVEYCKCFIGIKAPFAITPYQLYKLIEKRGKNGYKRKIQEKD